MTHHPDIVAEARGHSAYAGDLYDRLAALIEAQAAEIARAKEAMSYAEMYLRTGREECPRCGFDQTTADLDAAYELREAMQVLGWPQLETAIASGVIEEKGSE